MEFNDEDVVKYVPDVGDNRYAEEEAQVWVEMIPMTGEELRAYQRGLVTVKPNSADAVERATKVVRRIMKERVLKVHGYADIKGKSIETGDDLFCRGEPAMYDDVYEGLTVISKLKEGLKKS